MPSAQCRQSFCVVLTRDHHVRHLHQCPEIVSLTRRATSCPVPSEKELILCIPQSANICDIEYPDTSALEHFSSLAGFTEVIQRTHTPRRTPSGYKAITSSERTIKQRNQAV